MRILLLPVLTLLAAAPLQSQRSSGCVPVAGQDRPGDAEKRALHAAIVDSLRAEITAAARGVGIAEPAGLVAIHITDLQTGAAEATAFQGNVPDVPLDAVLARRGALLARWPELETWLHVRLDGPHPPEDAAVECLPAPRNTATFQRELARILQDRRPEPGAPRRVQMSMRLLVSRGGEVVFGVMTRRGPGAALDRAVLDAARRELRFRPATVGGVPVDVWVEIPIEF